MSSQSSTNEVKGSWTTSIDKTSGEYKRKESIFRNWIGGADGQFPPESGRYHLYVSYACPWAHRTLIVRALKGLEKVITYDVVDYHLDGATGWKFNKSNDSSRGDRDSIHDFDRLRQVYEESDSSYSGNVTVPVLYDKKTKRIVNNESSEIIQMLNNQFNSFSASPQQAQLDLYPSELKSSVDDINGWIYTDINNGVYRCGFAQSQAAYEEAFHKLFKGLDRVESILSKQRYLVSSSQLTLADVRLFTTLIRFDTVYHGHFKTNLKKLLEYPSIYNYMKELYQIPSIKETVNHHHIKQHYMGSHKTINPLGIISLGPPIEDLDIPHNREQLFPIQKQQ